MRARRDRAALALALECLRSRDLRWALTALTMMTWRHGETSLVASLNAWANGFGGWDSRLVYGADRVLRARLALYLRAVLRVERGDLGRVHSVDRKKNFDFCRAIQFLWHPLSEGPLFHELIDKATQAGVLGGTRRITPLWERASATRAR